MSIETELEYSPNSPFLKEIRKTPISFLKKNNYGVRKIKNRIKTYSKGSTKWVK